MEQQVTGTSLGQIEVYQTDANGIYTHSDMANELPLSRGTYNVPYGAKLTRPPETPPDKAALAVGESWTILDDHRQDTFYRADTGEKYEFERTIALDGGAVRYIGVGEVPAWLTSNPPAPEVREGAPVE